MDAWYVCECVFDRIRTNSIEFGLHLGLPRKLWHRNFINQWLTFLLSDAPESETSRRAFEKNTVSRNQGFIRDREFYDGYLNGCHLPIHPPPSFSKPHGISRRVLPGEKDL